MYFRVTLSNLLIAPLKYYLFYRRISASNKGELIHAFYILAFLAKLSYFRTVIKALYENCKCEFSLKKEQLFC